MPRVLIDTTATYRLYQVTDAQGKVIGEDKEMILTTAQTNEKTLQDKGKAALNSNATYLALTAPTTAQVTAQVKLLTQECNALIRLQLDLLDTTTGT